MDIEFYLIYGTSFTSIHSRYWLICSIAHFGRRNIPVYYKVGFSFLLAVILSFSIPVPDLREYSSLLSFILLVAKEFVIGLTLGFISYLITTSIYLAGQIIDMHIGFGMVNVFDPLTNIQIPVTANFYFIVASLMLLVIDGHHLLIYTLCDSFTLFPIGSKIVIEQSLRILLLIFLHPSLL